FGVYIGIATRDAIVPGVVTWATIAIAVTARDTYVVAAVAALGVAVGGAATCVIILLERRDPFADLPRQARSRRTPPYLHTI
ncbi:MAG: hypothetical protein H0T79_17380, partial [Deltaproteobacteria bacterium]|nr:hypothetical protein [Deltaproteobacteria bacterium]